MRRLAKTLPVLVFGMVTTLSAAPDTGSGAGSGSGSGSGSAATAPAPVPIKTMSVGEMNTAVGTIEARLEDDTQQVMHLQEVAKRQKDVIKLNCVNDRMVQLKAQRNIADDQRNQLNLAISKNSDDRQGLFDSYNQTAEKIKELREQAKACIGTPEMFKQESGVTVEHPVIPDNPTITPPLLDDGIEPPGYASPWS